jgi:hypothetical protein
MSRFACGLSFSRRRGEAHKGFGVSTRRKDGGDERLGFDTRPDRRSVDLDQRGSPPGSDGEAVEV